LKAAELLGADRALRKPFGIDDVLAALTDVLPAEPAGPVAPTGPVERRGDVSRSQ
jgi:hypothetical protein